MPWFFSYSDLGPQEVTALLGKAPLCMVPASLSGSYISFKGKSRKWGGAVASLEKSRKGFVYGSALLLPPEDLDLIQTYYKGMEPRYVPIFIDATQDKIKAITFVAADSDAPGSPSDDYVKAILKHLKFFWGQSGGKKPTLEDFGIDLNAPVKQVKKEVSEPISEENADTQPLEAQYVKRRRRRSKQDQNN